MDMYMYMWVQGPGVLQHVPLCEDQQSIAQLVKTRETLHRAAMQEHLFTVCGILNLIRDKGSIVFSKDEHKVTLRKESVYMEQAQKMLPFQRW